MKKSVFVLAMFLLSASATSVLAKDICVANQDGKLFKFDNVRLIRNKTTSLVGRIHPAAFLLVNNSRPMYGSVTVRGDNAVVEVFVTGGMLVPTTWHMYLDKNFEGAGRIDRSPYNSGGDDDEFWTNIPCNKLFPPA